MTSPCPDADTLVALAEGRIPAEESRGLAEHVAECSLCGLLVADLEAPRSTSAPTVDAVVEDLSDTALGLPLDAGEMAGRYRVLRVVGQGAMGVVYEAEDPKLDRRVAVKALKVSPTDRVAGVMLREEGRSLGQLQHPNVVPVFDVGTCRLGWFIAMEFVDGEPLDAWCEAQPWTAIVDRFVEAAEGLAAAHQVGIVHRDFKPGNVLVGKDDRARVADFGIAVSSSSPGASHTLEGSQSGPRPASVSATKHVIGTPAYMAPEQLMGQPATARSDQFALFVSLFEVLEGRRPFTGSTPESLLASRESGAKPLTRSDLPSKLVDLISTGLSFEPEQRHRSMSEVAAVLRAVRTPKARPWKWIVAVGIAGGAAFITFPSVDRESRCESPAIVVESTWQGAQRPAFRARWQGSLSTERFNRMDQRLDLFARQWATEFAAACGQKPGDAAPIHACLRDRSTSFDAALRVSLQEETSASKLMDVLIGGTPASSCSKSNHDSRTTSLAGSRVIDGWNAESHALYSADRFASANALIAERWEAIDRFGTPEQRARALLFRGLTELFSDEKPDGFEHLIQAHGLASAVGADQLVANISLAVLQWAPLVDPESAETWAQRARADVERADNPRLSARFYVAIGLREHKRGRFEDATKAADAAEKVLHGLESNSDVGWMVASLRGHIALGQQGYDVSVVHFESALELLDRLRGPGSILGIRPLAGLAQALLAAGDVESAADVLEMRDALLAATKVSALHRSTTSILRGLYFEAVGDMESAVLEARAQADRTDPTHRQWSGVQTRLGLALLGSRDYAEAREVFERIRVRQEEQLGSQSLTLAITLHNLAEAESGLGELDSAAEHYREALSIADHSKSPVRAYSLTGLGELELRRGNLELARRHLSDALAVPHDDEAERAEARASFARTLWSIGGPTLRAQALELTDQAAATFDDIPGYEQSALELSRWRETL